MSEAHNGVAYSTHPAAIKGRKRYAKKKSDPAWIARRQARQKAWYATTYGPRQYARKRRAKQLANPTMTTCGNCGAEYQTGKNCRSCNHARVRKTLAKHGGIGAHQRMLKYGLTAAAYAAMVARQGGHCASCGGDPGKRGLLVDHCHATGNVRGLLCHNCNVTLGLMKDLPERLQRAAEYLRRTASLVTDTRNS